MYKDDWHCDVESYKALDSEVCKTDFDTRSIIIRDAFKEVDIYSGQIKITLSRIRNPETNIDLKPFIVETFDDAEMKYPIDKLEYLPALRCNYPCYTCSGIDKDFCMSCWPYY